MTNSYITAWQKRNPDKVARTKARYYAKVGDKIKLSQRERYATDIVYKWTKQSEALENYYWRKSHPFEVQCLIFGKIKM
jgi:hypothetical protein